MIPRAELFVFLIQIMVGAEECLSEALATNGG
jgi:hypothetical protein